MLGICRLDANSSHLVKMGELGCHFFRKIGESISHFCCIKRIPDPTTQSSQAALANLTSFQLNSAQCKALGKEQEQAQAEAREKKTRDDEEKEQKHQAKRQVRHEAYIAKNDELPPCPLRCRVKECTVAKTRPTQTRAPPQLGTAACGTSGQRKRGRRKTLEGGPRARGTAPRATSNARPTTQATTTASSSPTRHTRCLPSSSRPRRQMHHMQTWSRENLRPSSHSSSSSLSSNSSGSSSSSGSSGSSGSSSSDSQCLLPLRALSHRRAKTRRWRLY
jgi:hypothetical protein